MITYWDREDGETVGSEGRPMDVIKQFNLHQSTIINQDIIVHRCLGSGDLYASSPETPSSLATLLSLIKPL